MKRQLSGKTHRYTNQVLGSTIHVRQADSTHKKAEGHDLRHHPQSELKPSYADYPSLCAFMDGLEFRAISTVHDIAIRMFVEVDQWTLSLFGRRCVDRLLRQTGVGCLGDSFWVEIGVWVVVVGGVGVTMGGGGVEVGHI